MRSHGQLTRWNDERGFGFITPAAGGADVFVHVSAFPGDGRRPETGETVSFELERAPDGRQRAVRVMRPADPTRVSRGRKVAPQQLRHHPRAPAPRSAGGLVLRIVLVAVGAALAYQFYLDHQHGQLAGPALRATPETTSRSGKAGGVRSSSAPDFACDGRRHCAQMGSCEEATYFLRNCPNTAMDGDHDGIPCESQWCR